MAERPSPHLPGRYLAQALATAAARALVTDWRNSGLARWFAERPRPTGFRQAPLDPRPTSKAAGQRILDGTFRLTGQSLTLGLHGDPWDRPNPGRAYAEALHRFEWLGDLLAAGPDGVAEALRLLLAWRRTFGRWNAFSWSPEIMSRRVVTLSCAGRAIAARASEAEAGLITANLARQARSLLNQGDRSNAAERAVAAAIAGAALDGVAGRRLLERSLRSLVKALPHTLRADGGHATRRPDAALELLLDLQVLEASLEHLGRAMPDLATRAIDSLAAAIRFATLADGALAVQQGGVTRTPADVASARAQDEVGERPTLARCNGYQRLDSARLQVMVDCAAPPTGPWSTQARLQPLSLEVLADGVRLIASASGRTLEDASSLAVGDHPTGRRLKGFAGRVLGARLIEAATRIDTQRHEGPGAVWLDVESHSWIRRFGLLHHRRLFLDTAMGELRGEDRLTPTAKAQGPDGRHFVAYVLRFQLYPGVNALVSQNNRSVLLRAPGAATAWVLRNDLLDVVVEPAAGPERLGQQVVLRGLRRADSGARVRWKLGPAASRSPVDGSGPSP